MGLARVQDGFQNLVLGVVLLHLARGRLLTELSPQAAIGAIDESGVHVADELLRDRTRAPALAENIVLQSPGDADDIHAVVLIEAVVFDRDESLRQIFRQRSDGDAGADLLADLANQRAVARENEGRLRHRDDRPGRGVPSGGLLRMRQRGRKQKRGKH